MSSYDYWHRALALVGDGGKLTRAQVTEIGGVTQEPCCGFWAKPVKEIIDGKRVRKPALPVAIWHDGEAYRARVNGITADPDEVWTWCAMTPISYETYVAVGERGERWPDREEVA